MGQMPGLEEEGALQAGNTGRAQGLLDQRLTPLRGGGSVQNDDAFGTYAVAQLRANLAVGLAYPSQRG
jgi:hypothetical protein